MVDVFSKKFQPERQQSTYHRRQHPDIAADRALDDALKQERSEELATAGVLLGVKGAVEVETAVEEAKVAREVGEAGIMGIAEGSELLGAAEASS